jgi:hypothetical protein
MKKDIKSILLFIYKDNTRETYSIPNGINPKEMYNKIVRSESIDESTIKDILIFPATYYDLEDVQYFFDEKTEKVNEKLLATNFKIDEFRKQRSHLFKILDGEFMRSLEAKDCDDCTDKIVKIKNHMRHLPQFLEGYLNKFTVDEITNFNPFNNIYEIGIINGGSGYTEAPTVTISAPEEIGVQMEAKAYITDGSVYKIDITQHGSGYSKPAGVSFSIPKNGKVAIAVTSGPENNTFKN